MNDVPPVRHAINCLCARCIAARQEEAAGRGKVFRLTPGTAEAITAAYMFQKRRPTRAQVEREVHRLRKVSR